MLVTSFTIPGQWAYVRTGICWGTEGSNPPPSSGESANHRSLKLAAYTHIVRLTNDTIAAPTVPDIAAETRQTYKGPLVIGEDLMTFDIGDGGVAVYRSAP